MTAEELALVAGGEVHIWSEQTGTLNIGGAIESDF